jgi:hypothetical protein
MIPTHWYRIKLYFHENLASSVIQYRFQNISHRRRNVMTRSEDYGRTQKKTISLRMC